ncbi:Spc97/Spc98 family protein [Neofusicoccum parvum]|nr:Spc97/Spc98 family protein [Neofusicoccum parvum]
MLHEILLSLSGHPSSLFDAEKPDSGSPITPASFPLLSPPEAELLSNIARLAQLHRAIRSHAQTVSSSHPSTICRAVATAITSSHLAKFQQKILDVEARILKQDASIVGAYNIVPLAGVVAEFDEWTRRMEWYWEMACFMLPKESASKSKSKDSGACTGAGLIDRLRQEAQTGYPDVEAAALDLSKVAETAWLRQLSAWVLYGRLPTHGMKDFFIAQIKGEDSIVDYISDSKLLPKFVSARTASSILFIGRSLDQIRNRGAVVFLLSEFVGYFEGEVVQESWKNFRRWIVGSESDTEQPSSSSESDNEEAPELSRPPTQHRLRQSQQLSRPPTSTSLRPSPRASHDPEILASAHRLFLRSLSYSLLLTDLPYTHALRSFLTHVDELVAFIERLRTVQQNLDLERDEGVVDALANYEQEEKDVLLELDRARKRVDSDLRSLVGRLRELDKERVGTGLFGDGETIGGFEPWKGGGVDRLLMKLDFGASANEDVDDEMFDLV